MKNKNIYSTKYDDDLEPIFFRIPKTLKEQVEESAIRNRRSLTQEITIILDRHCKKQEVEDAIAN